MGLRGLRRTFCSDRQTHDTGDRQAQNNKEIAKRTWIHGIANHVHMTHDRTTHFQKRMEIVEKFAFAINYPDTSLNAL
jgi:hypothetical protein